MNTCPNLKPMLEWLRAEPKEGGCRRCTIGPVVQWYADELALRGMAEMSQELIKEATESGDYEQICRRLDKIKTQVGLKTKDRLLNFDCVAQNFDASAELQE